MRSKQLMVSGINVETNMMPGVHVWAEDSASMALKWGGESKSDGSCCSCCKNCSCFSCCKCPCCGCLACCKKSEGFTSGSWSGTTTMNPKLQTYLQTVLVGEVKDKQHEMPCDAADKGKATFEEKTAIVLRQVRLMKIMAYEPIANAMRTIIVVADPKEELHNVARMAMSLDTMATPLGPDDSTMRSKRRFGQLVQSPTYDAFG